MINRIRLVSKLEFLNSSLCQRKRAVRLVHEIRDAIKWRWWWLCVWERERQRERVSEKCNQWIHWRQIMEKCAHAYLFYLDVWHATNNNKDDLQNGLFLREYVFACVLLCVCGLCTRLYVVRTHVRIWMWLSRSCQIIKIWQYIFIYRDVSLL